MPKHKIINLYGVDIKIKDKSISNRKKITTQIDIKNYDHYEISNVKLKEFKPLYSRIIE